MAFDDQEQNQDDAVTALWQRKPGYTGQTDEQPATSDQNYGRNPEMEKALREMMAQHRTMPGPNGEYYKRVYPPQPKAEPSTSDESNESMFREILKKARTGDFSPGSKLMEIQDPNAVGAGPGYWPEKDSIFSTFYPGGKEAMVGPQTNAQGGTRLPVSGTSSEESKRAVSKLSATGPTTAGAQPFAAAPPRPTQVDNNQASPEQYSTETPDKSLSFECITGQKSQSKDTLDRIQDYVHWRNQNFRPTAEGKWESPSSRVYNDKELWELYAQQQQQLRSPNRAGQGPSLEVEQYIRQQADAYGIPQALALGLINKESHFDQSLTGSKGEVGLSQILPIHKHEIDMKRAASDWRYNVTAGLFLLKQAYEFAKENAPNDVIAATYARYNGGQKNWKYYLVRNSGVHYHVYGQTVVRHGQSSHVDGYMDFYRKCGGK